MILPPKVIRALLAHEEEKGCAGPWFAQGAGPVSVAALAITPDVSAWGQPLC